MTIFPYNSIDSRATVIMPPSATTLATVTASTAASENFTSQSRAPSTSEPISTDMKRLSTVMMAVITVSGGVMAVVIGLAVPCYIWRKREHRRFKLFF